MIRTHQGVTGDDDLKPDLTPLLDIIFIVMVFLLLTASVKLQSLDVELPQTDTQALQETQADPITVNITATEPYWALQGIQIDSWDAFKAALLKEVKASPHKPVVIGADRAGSVENMLKLLAFLQQNKIKATQLLMEEDK
ncbi:biopolymer transporter ExbD [Photobacterium gaetbulicola]|uniref:TonB system transport protein n=1 Tax=Photobacterium gaetbulicola Gung47 TaxID=658445 RepID=A0A0C5WRH8_9GAMM|nr:biopolymer transporter ExbD [Photobacterium gaetbulicola]AJR08962.1 TonB system transport protein [Photobacterium gaetbulicola Gung47]PSU13518.1 biopolymer transporter ExbD [Photobacterium gaetbulicola]